MFYEFEHFLPGDFLELSKELYFKIGTFESTPSAIKRNVYSRVYYATFLYVREWLVRYKQYASNKRDHTEIPNFIRHHGPFNPVDNQKIASDLERLKKLRHQADYYLTRDDCFRYGEIWINDDIDFAFETADNIINKFLQCRNH